MKAEVVRSKWPRVTVKFAKGRKGFKIDARRRGTNGKEEWRADKAKALARANEIAVEFAANGNEGLAISAGLRYMALKGEEMLNPHGKTVLQACEFYRDYLDELQARQAGETVEKLALEWYEFKKSGKRKKLRKDSLIGIRRGQLEVTRAFGSRPVTDIRKGDVTAFLDAQPIAPISKKNLCSLFGQFFNWCIDEHRGITANPTKDIVYVSDGSSVPIWTPAEAEQAMRLCETEFPEFLTFHAIGLFAGLRPKEAQQIRWEHIDLGQRHIFVPKHISKVKDDRTVDIEDNLWHWLQLVPEEKRKGLVVRKENFTNRVKRFRGKLGYRYKTLYGGEPINPAGARGKYEQDVLRHCYGSYWLAKNRNRAQLAENMGNSIEVIKDHYKRPVSKMAATEFFTILPKALADERQRKKAEEKAEQEAMEALIEGVAYQPTAEERAEMHAELWKNFEPDA